MINFNVRVIIRDTRRNTFFNIELITTKKKIQLSVNVRVQGNFAKEIGVFHVARGNN